MKPWLVEQWCIPTVSAEFVWRMEDILDVYHQKSSPKYPLICFDERPTQLLSDKKIPSSAKPGQKKRIDYEYERKGNCNLFIFLEPQQGWRHVEVTDRRTAVDFAHCMKKLVDVYYPEADVIKIVMDNLNTHTPASLYKTFRPQEARRILQKLEFHYTPKHGSWLNMAEIEISILARQCLNRRIPEREAIENEIFNWEHSRNQEKATVSWGFQTKDARVKLKKLYPNIELESPPASQKQSPRFYFPSSEGLGVGSGTFRIFPTTYQNQCGQVLANACNLKSRTLKFSTPSSEMFDSKPIGLIDIWSASTIRSIPMLKS